MLQPSGPMAVAARRLDGAPAERRPIGRGRSGAVYAEARPGAVPTAVKVFVGDRAADAVNALLSGAPVPYAWSEEAIRVAFYRRRILAALVETWLPGILGVARPLGFRFNGSARAWELRCELVRGRPAALHQPFSGPQDGEQSELRTRVMRPLQRHLREAGFVGTLWQAGLGNPVATDNFLRNLDPHGPRWMWIDLESGVPALFSPSPRALLGTYVPWSLRLGHPLFDDVDVVRLHTYLAHHYVEIRDRLGPLEVSALARDAALLERYQGQLGDRRRVERGVMAALVRGRIDESRAREYLRRPWRWVLAEGARVVHAAGDAVARRLGRAARRLAAWRPLAAVRATARFAISSRARRRTARWIVVRRLRYWRARGQLTAREAGYLRRLSRHRGQAAHLTDFAVHVALKPAYKAVAWIGLPLLAQLGLLPLWLLPVAWTLAGSVARTLYTLGRCAGNATRREPLPWVALLVGVLPFIGSIAYPCQIVHSARGNGDKLAALVLYDSATALGRRVPIWGGPDSATEHLCNRLPDAVVGDRSPLLASP